MELLWNFPCCGILLEFTKYFNSCLFFFFFFERPERKQLKLMANWTSSEKVFYLNPTSYQFKSSQVSLAYAWRGKGKTFLDTRQCIICASPDTFIFSLFYIQTPLKLRDYFLWHKIMSIFRSTQSCSECCSYCCCGNWCQAAAFHF